MELIEAHSIAVRYLYYTNYGGKHEHFSDVVQRFMSKFPRGKGIKKYDLETLRLYQACLIVNAERSRTKAYRPVEQQVANQ